MRLRLNDRIGLAVEGELDDSLSGSGDRTFPTEINFGLDAPRIKGDPEVVSPILDLQFGNFGRDGRPVLIAYRCVDPAQDFVFTHAKVAQEDILGIETHRDRTGP